MGKIYQSTKKFFVGLTTFLLIFQMSMLGFLLPNVARAATMNAGPNGGNTVVDSDAIGSFTWSSPVNAKSADGLYATADLTNSGLRTHYLKALGYGFSIPSTATITGITLAIKRHQVCTSEHGGCTSTVVDNTVSLVKAGVVQSSNKASAIAWNETTDTIQSYGGDLWGTTWTPADINNANFGVVLTAERNAGNSRRIFVDSMLLSVSYTSVDATPVITVNPYNTAPTNKDIVVTATTDVGTLNFASHTFSENGSFDFVATNGSKTTTATVTITNIDKVAPTAIVTYSPSSLTNTDVLATANPSETVTYDSTGGSVHTFTENGNFSFGFHDTAGNTGSVTATVDWIDKAAPTVINVTSLTPEGAYNAGKTINVTVHFSKPVTISFGQGECYMWQTLLPGTPCIGWRDALPYMTLETGTIDRNADYVSGNGTNTLTFRYLVQPGDTSPHLDYSSSSSLQLNGGSLKDLAGNDANITLPNPGEKNSLGADSGIIIDTTAPELEGSTPVYLEVGLPTYDFLSGVTANDTGSGISGDVVVLENMVDLATIGDYYVDYSVSDNAGNVNTLRRYFYVRDTQNPVITVLLDNPATVELGHTYIDAGATALDSHDGDITNKIEAKSNVDTTKVGHYLVTYDVTDSSGNEANQMSRVVNVVDTTAPIITLNGLTGVILTFGDSFTDPGATTDDGSSIVISGNVNTGVAGTYYLYYDSTDAAGNKAVQKVRTVVVNAPAVVVTTTPPATTAPAATTSTTTSTPTGEVQGATTENPAPTTVATPTGEVKGAETDKVDATNKCLLGFNLCCKTFLKISLCWWILVIILLIAAYSYYRYKKKEEK